jgi:hypothetical protein
MTSRNQARHYRFVSEATIRPKTGFVPGGKMKGPGKLSTAVLAVSLVAAAVPLSTTSADAAWGWRGGGWGGGWRGGGWGWGGFGVGLAAGALIGGTLAAPYWGGYYNSYPGYNGYYAPSYYAYAPSPAFYGPSWGWGGGPVWWHRRHWHHWRRW